jgi:uncharacterized surface protein with fasciclin (FAS1) repeats
MFRTTTKVTAAVALTFASALALSACSMGESTTEEPMTSASAAPEMTEESPSMDAAASLVGPGCADYAAQVPDGAGSVEGMSQDPVATAASNNPLLTTLVQAASGELNPDVNLVDTLNSGEYTVFAPIDDAFGKIDPAVIESLKTDSATLTSILTYHVVEGQAGPDDIVGTHTTLQGADVEVTGSGDELMVGDAMVVCGGVQTANATVYLIDTVLMPPMQ